MKKGTLFCVISMLLMSCFCATAQQPNILILFSDQHRASCMGYEGHPDVITPNLDQLAADGVRFSRAYCQDAICAPSRQSFMTGLYPRTLGVMSNGEHTSVQNNSTPMALTFQQNGYATATFGKRHLADGTDRGWDVEADHLGTDPGYYRDWLSQQGTNPNTGNTYTEDFGMDWAAEFGRNPEATLTLPKADLGTRTTSLPETHTMEAWTAMRTIDYIQNRDPGKPFFIWATFYRPHQPYNPLQKYLDMYDQEVSGWIDAWGTGRENGGKIKKPANLQQTASDLPPLMENWRNNTNLPWNCGTAAQDHQIYRNYIGGYYALITEIDKHVGDILQTLEDEGLSSSLSDLSRNSEKIKKKAKQLGAQCENQYLHFILKNLCDSQSLYFLSPTDC